MVEKKAKLKVYFDGSCYICYREMSFYKKKEKAKGKIEFVDISSSKFSSREEGLESSALQKRMHVRLSSGALLTGAEAFAALWAELGLYPIFVNLLGNKKILPFANFIYLSFAKLRVLLPKRKDCDKCL